MKYYDLNTTFGFGKHKGETLMEVYISEPSYIDWCLREVKKFVILRNTFDKLTQEGNYNFTKKALKSIIDDYDESIIEDEEYEWGGNRHQDDFFYWQLEQHPVLKNRCDARRLLEEAAVMGIDPEDVISNLE